MRVKNEDKIHIKRLIKEYCYLEDGFHIENYLDLILICDEMNIYISRRSLKHFIERRKKELLKNNNLNKTIEILISMVLYIDDIIKNPDFIKIEKLKDKIIYEKVYDEKRFLSIRVVTEIVKNNQEVKSLHFVKIKKPP